MLLVNIALYITFISLRGSISVLKHSSIYQDPSMQKKRPMKLIGSELLLLSAFQLFTSHYHAISEVGS